MKCPIDQTEMEKGYITGPSWTQDAGLTKRMPVLIGTKLDAYKCPKCGKVELTTETK